MRLQNNILIFFYALFFFIYFNFDSVELKIASPNDNVNKNESLDPKDNAIDSSNEKGVEGSEDVKEDGVHSERKYVKKSGVNILSIESNNKPDNISNNNEETNTFEETNTSEYQDRIDNEKTNGETDTLFDSFEDEMNDEKENEETNKTEENNIVEEDDKINDADELNKETSTTYDRDIKEEKEIESESGESEKESKEEIEENKEEIEENKEEIEESKEEIDESKEEIEEIEESKEDSEEESEESEEESEESEEESEESEEEKEKENSNEENNYKSEYAYKADTVTPELKKNGISWNRFNLFSIFKKPLLKKNENNYFRREIQNEFAFKNGLYFTATSAASYNRLVAKDRYASMPFPGDTMIFVVTANKFFFQDLIYSSNKYLSIKKKFAYLMNSIIYNLKSKYYFKNYNYQFLYRDDSFAGDSSKKVLDFALLGDLSKATQTIYVDDYRGRLSMHKLYGGWFHFLGILVVNGYSYNVMDNLGGVEVVPYHLIDEFKKKLYRKESSFNNGYLIGLWRDFPNNKYSVWRYSVELFLWDILNMMPYQLPHPASFVLSYNEYKNIDNKNSNEQLEEYAESSNNILNWHVLLKKYISEIKGLDVVMVSANDYLEAIYNKSYRAYLNKYRNYAQNNNGYIFLILLNKDFFSEVLTSHHNYQEEKKNCFFEFVKDVLDKLTDLLNKLKDAINQAEDDNNKPTFQFYNYLLEETNYDKINPHILGEVAGITKYIKCNNHLINNCTKDVSLHYKYGGWFEFGGAIYVKNVNNIQVNYEKHNIIDKNDERNILQKANCSTCRYSEFWRDLPRKDMSKYRYPLNVFVLERPDLDLKDVNLQNIHPFVLLRLIKRGIEADKQFSKKNIYSGERINNTEENSEESSEESVIESIKENDYTNEETKESDKLSEDYLEDEKQKIGEKNKDNITEEFIENEEEEDQLNEVQNDVENEENEKQIDDMKSKSNEEDEDSKVFGSSDEENGLLGEYNSVDELDEELNKDENWLYKQESEENNNGERLEDEEIDKLLLGSSSKDNNKSQDNAEDSLDEMNHLYEVYEGANDLHNVSSDSNSKRSYKELFLFLIGCIIVVCIAFIIGLGIKLYKNFVQKKMLDKNKIVLAFKDKEEIPVVQGIPAPWLNT